MVLASIDRSLRVPPALIPKWALSGVADYVTHQMSLRPGMGPKRRKDYADLLRGVLEQSAVSMAHQFYQYYRGRWMAGCPADEVLRQYGEPPNEHFLLFQKEAE